MQKNCETVPLIYCILICVGGGGGGISVFWKKGFIKNGPGFFLFSDFFFPLAYSNQSGPGSSNDG